MKKQKGFTLIELLAVIAILAILVLVATPAVTNIMTKSAKSSFKNEVMGFVKDADKAYTDKIGNEVNSRGNTSSTKTVVKNVTATDLATNVTKNYSYYCATLSDLVNEQYTKKDLGTSYGGYIQMWVPDGEGETITFVAITNSRFYVAGRTSDISPASYLAEQIPDNSLSLKDAKCPTTYDILTTESINDTIRSGYSANISEVK